MQVAPCASSDHMTGYIGGFGVWQVARPSLGMDSVDMLAGILTGETMDAITRNILQENHCIFLLLHTFWEVRAPPATYMSVSVVWPTPHVPADMECC